MEKPTYINWIVTEENVVLDNGEPITCYRLDYTNDEAVLDDWALHIRRHYISDDELEEGCGLLDLTPEEYLKQLIIPQKSESRLSGTARSNGISEILFSDLLEFVLKFEVPRCRFDNMSGKTVSEHGTDVIAYEFFNADKKPDSKDMLATVEVKAELTSQKADVIDKAVEDACKDEYRLAQTLDYMRRKLIRMNMPEKAKDILRFQNKTKYDYQIEHYAAGISSLPQIPNGVIDGTNVKIIPEIDGNKLRLKGDAHIYYVHGERLMELAHRVYDRCVK